MMNMDLSRIMDTYRGHEDRLKKRVELSNDLLELIAYEQLTREKRQLIAAQQAKSMPPGGMPTIKEQKEDEAFDLTKQELAQQIGKTFQQKAAQQGRPPMMAGVAAAPGAQNVMPPQAMAAGGIVAFDSGGPIRAEYSEAGLPNAPEGIPAKNQALSVIAKMDDATVTATASKLTGMPFESPLQARVALSKMFGDTTIDAGMSGGSRKVSGLSLGASMPAMGGTMRAGVDLPRGSSPAFSLGYNRQFDRGGIVSLQSGGMLSPEEIAARLRSGTGLISLSSEVLGNAPQSRNPQALIAWNERKKQFDENVRAAQELLRQGGKPTQAAPSTAPAVNESYEPTAVNVPRPQPAAAPAPAPRPSAISAEAGAGALYDPESGRSVVRGEPVAAPPPQTTDESAAAIPPSVTKPQPPANGIPALLQENPNLMNQLQGIFAENTVAARNKRDTPQLDEVAKLRKQIAELKYPTTPPEITRARQEDQQKLEEYYQRMNDPEAQRIKNLTAFLLGGAGRRGIGSVLGGAGEASARSAAAQEAAGLQALKDMQAGRESLRGAQLQEQQAIFQSNLKKAELGGNIAKVAAEIEAQLNIKDQDVNRALAETALRSLTTYGSDLNKIAADIQKEAAERGVRMSTNEATNLTQIIVARIQAGGAESRAKEKEISDLVTEEAKLRERLIDNRNKEIEKNIGLGSALNKAPDKRSVAEQRLVDEFESRMQNDKTLLKGIQDRLAELRGRPTSSASAGSTGSASSQGVKVTGASAPR